MLEQLYIRPPADLQASRRRLADAEKSLRWPELRALRGDYFHRVHGDIIAEIERTEQHNFSPPDMVRAYETALANKRKALAELQALERKLDTEDEDTAPDDVPYVDFIDAQLAEARWSGLTYQLKLRLGKYKPQEPTRKKLSKSERNAARRRKIAARF